MKINEEFKKLIPPLSVEEFNQLQQNCISEGIRDKIITWNGFIIDGHNRYEIATRHNLKYETESKEFDNENDVREWMINNQFGRRNLSNYQRSVLALELESVFSKRAKEQQSRKPKSVLAMLPKQKPINTRAEIAKIADIKERTLGKVKVIVAKATPEVKAQLSTGEVSINQVYQEIKKEDKKVEQEVKKQAHKDIIESVQSQNIKNIDATIEKGWYKVGNQFLYYGSNLDKEFIDFLPKAKFAFADPPYNAGVDEWDFNFKWELDYLENYADVVAVTAGGWNACNFYKETNMNYIWEMFCWISNGMTHGKCGYANVIKTSIFGTVKPKIPQDFWKINIQINQTEDTKHKGRKPYNFMIHLIDVFTNENDIIIDVFAGSGTTLLMCEKMNRVSYNAEINKQYCIDIIKRIGAYEKL